MAFLVYGTNEKPTSTHPRLTRYPKAKEKESYHHCDYPSFLRCFLVEVHKHLPNAGLRVALLRECLSM